MEQQYVFEFDDEGRPCGPDALGKLPQGTDSLLLQGIAEMATQLNELFDANEKLEAEMEEFYAVVDDLREQLKLLKATVVRLDVTQGVLSDKIWGCEDE